MRVGVLTTSYPRTSTDPAGGFVAGLARWLVAQGAEVEVLAAGPGASADGPIAITRIDAPHLFYSGGAPEALARSPWAWLEASRFAGRLCALVARRRESWDFLVSHWLLPNGLCGAWLGRALPHLAIAHSGDVALLERIPGGAMAARAIAGSGARLVFVSEALRLRFGRHLGQAVGDVIAMGTDAVPGPFAEPSGPFRVLFLGRLVPIKGVEVLLRAARKCPHVGFDIAGQGPELARLRSLAPPNVAFLGEVRGRFKEVLLRSTHALCVPSIELAGGRTEGTPTVVAEALAAGRPIVASATGGLPRALGRAGLLVPPGDPDALAQTISGLAADRQLWMCLARQALRQAPDWSWSVVGPKLLGPLAWRFAPTGKRAVR